MASLLQVEERELCLDNELTSSSFFPLPNTLEAPAVVYPWSLTYMIINRLKDDV